MSLPPDLQRRACLRGAAALAAISAAPAFSQTAPTPVVDGPVSIVVPFPPGGRTSFAAQMLAVGLKVALDLPVSVTNRSGEVMHEIAEFAKLPPDGRTLMLASFRLPRIGVFSTDDDNRLINSLTPITLVARDPMVLVMAERRAAALGIGSIGELMAYVRKHPGRLTMASGQDGTTDALASELFKTMSRSYITRLPATSISADAEAVLRGDIDLLFATLHAARGSVQGGDLRALAVTAGTQYPALSLDTLGAARAVPLLQTQPGFSGFEVYNYTSLFAPSGMPAAQADALQKISTRALAFRAMQQRFLAFDMLPGGITRAEFAQLECDEDSRWRQARARW